MKEKYKYYLLTFIRYLGDSFFYPFFALYLHTKDSIGESKIGILIAITPFIGIIANPIFSKICKNFRILKNVLGVIGIIEAVVICVLLKADNFYTLLIFTILLSLFGSCHYGLFDSLLTIFSKENNINYSNIRVWGSIAYIVGTILAGVVIKKFEYDLSFYICAFCFFLASFLYFILKPIYKGDKIEEKRNFKAILKNKEFILYLIFYMLFYGVLKTSNNYYSLLLESRGLSSVVYGQNYALFVFVEVVLLIIFDKINKKLNYKVLLGLAIVSLTIMSFVNASKLPSIILIIFSMLRGVSWGIALHVSNKVIVSLLGLKNTTLGTMMLDLCYSIVVIIINTSGGYIIEGTSYNMFYLILAAIASIDAIFYFVFVRKYICVNDELDVRKETIEA